MEHLTENNVRWLVGPVIWQLLIAYCFVTLPLFILPPQRFPYFLSPIMLLPSIVILGYCYKGAKTRGASRVLAVLLAQLVMILGAFLGSGNNFLGTILFEIMPTRTMYPGDILVPFFNIVVPSVWAAILASPSMRRWTYASDICSSGAFQCTIGDLFFFMTVTGFAMALWQMCIMYGDK